MFSSQFDGNGFTQSQSMDSGPSPAKKRDSEGVIPVTVKQISEASLSGDEKSTFSIDGVDVTNVTLIGLVYDKVERVTDVAFTLDDGTGRIQCIRWVNETSDKKEMGEIESEMYVRVCGRLKGLQGKKQLVTFSVRPVTNFDEVSFHFIECIHFYLQNSRKQLQGDVSSQSQTQTVTNSTLRAPKPSVSNGFQHAGQCTVDGLKGFDQMVLDYLQQPLNYEREKGVHRDEICQKLKVPVEKIMESIRVLEEEGLIYSTIDEFHYKSTTCG